MRGRLGSVSAEAEADAKSSSRGNRRDLEPQASGPSGGPAVPLGVLIQIPLREGAVGAADDPACDA